MPTECPICRTKNPDSQAFCGTCGTRLSGFGDIQFTQTLSPDAAKEPLTPGQVFAGKYSVTGEIGRGGMGIVYLAEDFQLKRPVALKLLPAAFAAHPEAKERFLREARSAAALTHPNICTIHEVGEAEGQSYIAMEYVAGESLRQRIAKGPLGPDDAADIALQVAEGLEAARQRGIIHRDIKSANIMVTESGRAKIMDFGLAKAQGDDQLTREARTIGTVAYMSPEQARGEDLDHRTDLWSFGVVLYEMLTGELPFRGERESIMLHAITAAEPRPLRQLKPDVPAELQRVIERALRKKREDRYVSAADMAGDLKKYLEGRRAEEAGFFNLKSLAKRMKRPAYFIPAAAVLIAFGVFVYWRIDHNAHVRWARQVALPEIERLTQSNDLTAAYKLTKKAENYIAGDPKIEEHKLSLTGAFSLKSDPPGAQVFVKDYAAPDGDYELAGITPLDRIEMASTYRRWKVVKEGFETVESAGMVLNPAAPVESYPPFEVTLDRSGSLPAGMVRVRGGSAVTPNLNMSNVPPLKLGDYFLDRFEVTNREYKAFVNAGGYTTREFWKIKFVREGREVPWDEAIKSFTDRSGRPGPATWELGDFPEGQDAHPVSGVSWYEAAAYGEFVGKSLPTVYHWAWASGTNATPGMIDSGFMVPLSNFAHKGTTAAGAMRGMSAAGIYDMAGNVKEWLRNETPGGKRGNVGGGWDEPSYMFTNFEPYSPWQRFPNLGFRCMKPALPDPASADAANPIPEEPPPPPVKLIPCTDDMFKLYTKMYEYPKSPLNPKIELEEAWTRHTLFQQVSFDPAYMGDRTGAFIFIPREGRAPYQTLIHWPGGDALQIKSIRDYGPKDQYDYITKTGRAIIIPIIRGTFGHKFSAEVKARTTSQERRAMQVKDFKRSIDYLETRAEFEVKKLAYEGVSWGAGMGSIIPAYDGRIKAIVLLGAGFYYANPPDYNPINTAPRISAPVLIQNGRYDFFVSLEKEIQPLLQIFGAPDKDKTLKLYEAGHCVWFRMEQRRDEIDFLDKYFGPAK